MSDAAGRRLRSVAAASGALALAALASLGALVAATRPASPPAPEPRAVVTDAPASPGVPLYVQADARWGGLPYAGGTVATSGCGLACAAMAWEALSGEACTPADLIAEVGDSCTVGGLNYMPAFCEWMEGRDPSLSHSGPYGDLARALSDLRAGRLVFGSLHGALRDGGREYGGHLVLLACIDGGIVTVHDPCEDRPVELDRPELAGVSWDYFVSIGRG